LLLLQNLRDSSVPSVLIPKICKEAFSLIWTMPKFVGWFVSSQLTNQQTNQRFDSYSQIPIRYDR
jgi:hypothetical protein